MNNRIRDWRIELERLAEEATRDDGFGRLSAGIACAKAIPDLLARLRAADAMADKFQDTLEELGWSPEECAAERATIDAYLTPDGSAPIRVGAPVHGVGRSRNEGR